MKYFDYTRGERFRQLWRIPAASLFWLAFAIYAYKKNNFSGFAISMSFLFGTFLSGLWIMSWHPVIGIDEKGMSAFRLGLRLRTLKWTSIVQITKIPYHARTKADALIINSRFGLKSSKWRIEVIEKENGFFRMAFSSNINDINELVSELNLRVSELHIPINDLSHRKLVDSTPARPRLLDGH